MVSELEKFPVRTNVSISHGTLRSEDLISAFEPILREVDPVAFGRVQYRYEIQPGDSEDAEQYVMELIDALNDAAPEGYYFGTLEGDGSDFGFWSNPDQE